MGLGLDRHSAEFQQSQDTGSDIARELLRPILPKGKCKNCKGSVPADSKK